eukprot:2808077-Rhodomonas_salina.1
MEQSKRFAPWYATPSSCGCGLSVHITSCAARLTGWCAQGVQFAIEISWSEEVGGNARRVGPGGALS